MIEGVVGGTDRFGSRFNIVDFFDGSDEIFVGEIQRIVDNGHLDPFAGIALLHRTGMNGGVGIGDDPVFPSDPGVKVFVVVKIPLLSKVGICVVGEEGRTRLERQAAFPLFGMFRAFRTSASPTTLEQESG
jgi:hypothetical protein